MLVLKLLFLHSGTDSGFYTVVGHSKELSINVWFVEIGPGNKRWLNWSGVTNDGFIAYWGATMSPAFSHVAIDFTGHLMSMLCGENKSGKSHPMFASFHVQLQEWSTLSWQMTWLLIECIILYIMANKDITWLSLTYIWTTIDFTRLQREIAHQGWIWRFLWLVSNTVQAPLLPYHLWLGKYLLITEKCLNIEHSRLSFNLSIELCHKMYPLRVYGISYLYNYQTSNKKKRLYLMRVTYDSI